MSDKLRNALPWVALACGLTALVSIVLLSCWRAEALADTGETLASVESSLEPVFNTHPASIDDEQFLLTLDQVLTSPHVATFWVLKPDGEVVQARGATAESFSQGNARELSSPEIQALISALPDNALTDEQQTLLYAASAIRREGEHNDIYRHLVRQIRAPDGSVIGLIGIAYEMLSDDVGAGWIALVLLSLVGLAAYWLALPLWAWLDARRRGDRAWPWAVFVLLGNLMALLAYLLVRTPQQTRER